MALLSDQFARDVDPQIRVHLAWRAIWLHAAITGPTSALLAPREREALTLVATSVLGVHVESVHTHLRHTGSTQRSALVSVHRLQALGLVSVVGDLVDLPEDDLEWIARHSTVSPDQEVL